MSTIVQYIVVRGDLITALKWPVGAVIAQACHASTAIIHLHKEDAHVLEYTRDLDQMHKIVLEARNEENLHNLAETLEQNKVDFKLWIEQPENFPTCLATKPCPKENVQIFFKKFKLMK